MKLSAGVGGQAPSLAQELVKDWTDDSGMSHPGVTDENYPDMVRWSEAFPHAVKERFRLLEPRALRNKFFEAMKEEIPSGHVKMPVDAPKFDVLVMEGVDEKGKPYREERKLGKDELAAMIQIDLMKEEAVSIVRAKTAAGNITYGLPPEKKNKMHDDRVYVLAMFCWWVKQLQIDETLGESPEVDYKKTYLDGMSQLGSSQNGPKPKPKRSEWDAFLVGGRDRKRFDNPFSKNKKPF